MTHLEQFDLSQLNVQAGGRELSWDYWVHRAP